MTLIDIVTPTLGRADRLAGYVDNAHSATRSSHIITFVAERHDEATVTAVEALDDPLVRVVFNERTGNCLGAFNSAIRHITAPWWFGSGDDVVFGDGWDVMALRVLDDHPEAKVIGTNDLHNPYVVNGTSATHMLISTEYINTLGGTIDQGPGLACCEDYHHNFFDTELIEVAHQRGVWQPCLSAIVEHKHWVWGEAEYDATYEHSYQGGAAEKIDRALWARRRQLLEAPRC